MKKIFLAILFVLSSITIFGQTAKYFDAPFGGGGGYSPGWIIPNTDPLNLQLKALGIPELSTSGFYTSGGAGFIYIGFVKNLRVGGMGFGGTISESVSLANENREVVYSMGGGGLTLEYTLPFIKDLGVSLGAIIGGGAITVELYRNNGQFSWGNIWDEIGNGQSNNVSRTLTNNYWIFSPTLNIDISVYRFVLLRIGAGYQFTFGGDWEADNGQSLSNVPSDLNGNNFFIQSGIFVGFFSF